MCPASTRPSKILLQHSSWDNCPNGMTPTEPHPCPARGWCDCCNRRQPRSVPAGRPGSHLSPCPLCSGHLAAPGLEGGFQEKLNHQCQPLASNKTGSVSSLPGKLCLAVLSPVSHSGLHLVVTPWGHLPWPQTHRSHLVLFYLLPPSQLCQSC